MAEAAFIRRHGAMAFGRILAPIAVVLALVGCQGGARQVPQERIVRFFDDLVFGEDYALDRPAPDTIWKWSGPIRVSILTTGRHRAIAEAQFRRFAGMTGVSVEILELPERSANLEISFVEDKDFLVNREHVPCYARVGQSNGAIDRVRIVISEKDESLIEVCVVHELMHAFGFPNHSGAISSVMSPLHGEKQLTSWDELVLRALYDARLQPGMVREVAMPIARDVIRDAMSGPAVARAETNLVGWP